MRATVLPQPEPGFALLRITDLEASPEGLTLSIQRQQGPDSHLADDGWRRTETWLQPGQVARLKDSLEFQLGPEICDRLAGIATIRLRVREPDIGVVGTTVIAWPQMLTSGAVDPSSRGQDETIRLRGRQVEPPPPPPPPVEPPPAEEPRPPPMPELRAAREPASAPKRGGTGWMIAAALLLLLAGGGYFAYTNFLQPHDEEVAATAAPPTPPKATAATETVPEPPRRSVREKVGDYLATNPTPDAMLAKGRELEQAGDLNGAFLVWRRAAEAGNVAAQVEVASFYDPMVTAPKGGFAPDAARAADWYERAALAGNPEAQRKYGLLLARGGPGLAADQGRARSWLQQAAAQNDADAKKALDTLPK